MFVDSIEYFQPNHRGSLQTQQSEVAVSAPVISVEGPMSDRVDKTLQRDCESANKAIDR